ncbi:hypothetical protein AC579_7066 [Pseudocercospora musae]|uniref:Uncharacterized protein n=1 Tax=Pseudocercospora musae TaxID=113226 RepID=A0A139H4U5_9PEZI|nr:hypothetical protein AC579_7066 [Pseudocercospora musae]
MENVINSVLVAAQSCASRVVQLTARQCMERCQSPHVGLVNRKVVVYYAGHPSTSTQPSQESAPAPAVTGVHLVSIPVSPTRFVDVARNRGKAEDFLVLPVDLASALCSWRWGKNADKIMGRPFDLHAYPGRFGENGAVQDRSRCLAQDKQEFGAKIGRCYPDADPRVNVQRKAIRCTGVEHTAMSQAMLMQEAARMVSGGYLRHSRRKTFPPARLQARDMQGPGQSSCVVRSEGIMSLRAWSRTGYPILGHRRCSSLVSLKTMFLCRGGGGGDGGGGAGKVGSEVQLPSNICPKQAPINAGTKKSKSSRQSTSTYNAWFTMVATAVCPSSTDGQMSTTAALTTDCIFESSWRGHVSGENDDECSEKVHMQVYV